jgi:hypothetical protein
VEGDNVRLADDWIDRLEEARELAGEIEREECQREDDLRDREVFRRRGESRPDRHYVNAGADGHIEELRPVEVVPEESREAGFRQRRRAVCVRGWQRL